MARGEAAGSAAAEAHPGRGERAGGRGPEATGPAGAATGEGKARGRWGSARPGRRLGVLAARPPRAPLTGRSGWRTGSRRRGPTWWRRRREPEGARRCLAGPALNELARAVPWRGRGEAEPLRRRGGVCAPAANRTQPPEKPRPSHPPSSRPRAGAGSPGVRFWRRRGRGGAPLPEGSAAVGRSRRGTGRPRGSASPRVARVCMRPSPCPRPAVREAATGTRLLRSALRGNWGRFPVKEHSWPSWEARGCTKRGARNHQASASVSCCRNTQLQERSQDLGSVYTVRCTPPLGCSKKTS